MSVRSHGTWFQLDEYSCNLYVNILPKFVEKIQVSLKSAKNNGYFTWRRMYIDDSIFQFFSEWEMFRAKLVEKVKTLFPKVVACVRSWRKIWFSRTGYYDNIILRMRFACWITKTTDAHSEYIILVAFPQQQSLRDGATLLTLDVPCPSLFIQARYAQELFL